MDRPALFFISRTAELPNKQGVQINTSLYADETYDQHIAKLDLLERFTERVRLQAELPLLEHALQYQKDQLIQLSGQVEELQKKKADGKRTTSVEDQSLNNAKTNVIQLRRNIEQGEQKVQESKDRLKELSSSA
jgi:phage shock protein A